jgi:hypothetical protein
MKPVSIFVLVCSTLFANAQVKNFSIAVGVNRPVIADVINEAQLNPIPIPTTGYYSTNTNVGKLRQTYDGKTGFEVATSFHVFRLKKLFFETGIAFQYNRYKKSVTVDVASPGTSTNPISGISGQPYGTIRSYSQLINANGSVGMNVNGQPIFAERGENLGETTTFYVRIPVIVGSSFLKGRLLLKVGLVTDFLGQATQYQERYSFYSGISEYKDRNTKEFSKIMAGGLLRSTYLITKKIGVDLSYHRSFTRIYTTDEGHGAFYNIFSIGGSYYFRNFIN